MTEAGVTHVNTTSQFRAKSVGKHMDLVEVKVLSCQPRVTVTSCFVNKVIRDLESIDHLCINPIRCR